jgi:CheY-like chemotaxis protein
VSPSILIVDDHYQLRGFVRRVLEGAGYSVLESATGKEAMVQVQSSQIDLVITDIVMPDMEGLELIKVLNNARPDLRVIAVSGAFEGRFLRLAELLGVKATLQKPFNAKTLLETVRSIDDSKAGK